MSLDASHELPLASRIALAYCPAACRSALAAALALDQRCAQLVARTSEPMLGQMRLAWWRERLEQAASARPQGDAVLDALSLSWPGDPAPLIALVDGWEQLLPPEPLDEAAARSCAAGRAAALLAACGVLTETAEPAAAAAAETWALADLAAKVSAPQERRLLLALGDEAARRRARLGPQTRALAVLGALGARALARGGRPLMEGRGAALCAAKAAILLR